MKSNFMSDNSKSITNNDSQLKFLRSLIDKVDSTIISILANRSQIINYIIEYKKIHGLEVGRSELREKAIKEVINYGKSINLDESFIYNLLDYLYKESHTIYKGEIESSIFHYFKIDKNLLINLNTSLKNFDKSLCSLLSERMLLVKQVGEYKKINNIPPLVKARWQQVLESRMEKAKSFNLNPEVIAHFYTIIHDEALKIEASV